MYNCPYDGQLELLWIFVYSIDTCPWQGQDIKCPLTICLFALRVVSDQKCPQDLDLSMKFLTSLTHFLGHWVIFMVSSYAKK